MDEEYSRNLRKWLETEISLPLQRGVADAPWDSFGPLIPPPRSSPENREH
ncbi:MAG: hypothetical protein QOI21_4445 [Actinomycetota bacterium]|jgi:hypothetical protein|nr:hypothetical protein [Actinomycetota bacterium]